MISTSSKEIFEVDHSVLIGLIAIAVTERVLN
jgi:hypothetical protein